MPQAQDMLGTDITGTFTITSACDECSCKHSLFECQRKFTKDHPGKTMPGFDASCAKNPVAWWAGDKITPATRQQWLLMQGLGYFTVPPERCNPVSMQALH